MPTEIKVPSAGESITSAVISTWHKADGSSVQPGDVLVTIDTDKVSTELTAEAAGTLKIAAQPGEEVKIGAVIGFIAEGVPSAAHPPAPKETPPAAQPAAAPPVSPVPKVELTVVPKIPDPSPPAVVDEAGRVTRKRMSPLRRKIATHLVNAQHTAAILTTFNEVDMTEVMNLRKLLQESFTARHGVKLGFMSFFVKAVVEALQSVPQVNARIEGDEIIEHHYFDIGVAIGTERGLIVPVLRDCDQPAVQSCVACQRTLCTGHGRSGPDGVLCVECRAAKEQALGEDDDGRIYRHRRDFYRGFGYGPLYVGDGEDPLYDAFDVRSFDRGAATFGDEDDEDDGPASFADS